MVNFLAALFEPEDLIEYRALPGGKQWWRKRDDVPTAALTEANGRGLNIYFGANPRLREGGKTEDVALARCVFADLDGVMPGLAVVRIAQANLPPPTALVMSGGGSHPWWRLDEPIMLADWSARMRGLIAVLGSDRVVHDPPRVMRAPGFTNHKRGVKAEVVELHPGRVYAVAEFGCAVVLVAGVTRSPPGAVVAGRRANGRVAGPANLSRATLLFLTLGAPEGERETAAFCAACDFAGNGLGEGDCRPIIDAAVRSGLPEPEAVQAVRSAFARPRTPARGGTMPQVAPDAGTVPEPVKVGTRGKAATPPVVAPSLPGTGTDRPVVSNIRAESYTTPEGKPALTFVARPIREVSDDLIRMSGGWPKVAGGALFAVRETPPGTLPDSESIRWLAGTDGLFGWLHETCDLHWSDSRRVASRLGSPRTPPTKSEFRDHLCDSIGARYRGVALLPHVPAMPGMFYVPCDLPAPTGKRLAEFLDALNPETELDRSLMLAAMLTLLWGGVCGARPAFIFSSPFGRGSGKTATAQAIAKVVGGSFDWKPSEKWDQINKRLLSDGALNKRCILIDNVRGKFSGQDIESLLTSEQINGWRPYHGDFSRPNDLTLFITVNTPRLSKDLAGRCIIVHVGRQRHSHAFISWVGSYLAEHRAEVLADLVAVLRTEPVCVIPADQLDRWQDWQRFVLARVPHGDECAALVAERRPESDDDADEAGEVEEALDAWCAKQPGMGSEIEITREQMRMILSESGAVDKAETKRRVTAIVTEMMGEGGGLPRLSSARRGRNSNRVWVWRQSPLPPNTDIPV